MIVCGGQGGDGRSITGYSNALCAVSECVVLAGQGGRGRGGRRQFINSSSRVIGYRCSVPNIEAIYCLRTARRRHCPSLSAFAPLRCAARCFHFLDLYPPTTARARNDMDLARVDDDDHTTHYYYHYPFFPGPLRHSFPQCFRFFPSLSHHSLTHLHRVNICLGPFPLPAFATTFLPLFSFCFRFGCTTPPISLVPSSFHVHPFTLSLSYDYFLLPRICIFLPLTTLTTRASPSFKSTHSLPLLSLSLSLIYPSTNISIPGPFRFRRIRDTTNNHAQVRYASTSYCTRSTGSTLYTCSALPCSMSLRRVNLIFIQRSLAVPPLTKERGWGLV